MQLNQKEQGLLKDLKDQEQLCIEKYTSHSAQAHDTQLKNLFSQIAAVEKQHLDTITQIENGSVPQTGGGSQQQNTAFSPSYNGVSSTDKEQDKFFCSDVLATEKHASNLYNISIFEFSDENIRNSLNHIQKEEQQHGKLIYDYMKINGMYS